MKLKNFQKNHQYPIRVRTKNKFMTSTKHQPNTHITQKYAIHRI